MYILAFCGLVIFGIEIKRNLWAVEAVSTSRYLQKNDL